MAVGIIALSAGAAQASIYSSGSAAGPSANPTDCGELHVGIAGPLAFDQTTRSTTFSSVSLKGVDAKCTGWNFRVIAGGAGKELATASRQARAGDSNLIMRLSHPVDTAALTSWSVTAIK